MHIVPGFPLSSSPAWVLQQLHKLAACYAEWALTRHSLAVPHVLTQVSALTALLVVPRQALCMLVHSVLYVCGITAYLEGSATSIPFSGYLEGRHQGSVTLASPAKCYSLTRLGLTFITQMASKLMRSCAWESCTVASSQTGLGL